MQEVEECHIPEDEPSVEAVGRGSQIVRVAKAERPAVIGVYKPQSCNIKGTEWKEREQHSEWEEMRTHCRGRPTECLSPPLAQLSAAADHQASEPTYRWLQDRCGGLNPSRFIIESSGNGDWKLMRPFYSAIWPVSWRLWQTFQIYKFFLFGCSHRRRQRICSRRSC